MCTYPITKLSYIIQLDFKYFGGEILSVPIGITALFITGSGTIFSATCSMITSWFSTPIILAVRVMYKSDFYCQTCKHVNLCLACFDRWKRARAKNVVRAFWEENRVDVLCKREVVEWSSRSFEILYPEGDAERTTNMQISGSGRPT